MSGIVRKIIKWGTISLVVMALIPGTISLVKKIYLTLNPPPPPPPTVKYGKLPKLIFPEMSASATPEYKLETISGGLPAMANVGNVYLVGVNKSRLLVLDRMTQKAKTVGLSRGPDELDERTYRYTSPSLPVDMIFDVITESFSYKYDWTSDKSVYTVYDVPLKDSAEKEAKSFFQRMGVLQDDLVSGPVKMVYLTATSSAMFPANSPYEANFVRVDLYREDKDKIKFVTAGGDTSPINITISGQTGEKRIAQANYYYSQVIGDDYATYPLKSVETAWKELISGGGFIAKRSTDNKAVIRRVYLGYYEANEQQSFIQPVYVFEGDGGFMAYTQAVDDAYVTDSPTK